MSYWYGKDTVEQARTRLPKVAGVIAQAHTDRSFKEATLPSHTQ